MAITNPEAIAFINNRIRPRCEQIRALWHNLRDDKAAWQGGINSLIPNDPAELLEDGRDTEGVSRLDGAEITTVLTRINELLATMDAAGAMDPILKATVRPLGAT